MHPLRLYGRIAIGDGRLFLGTVTLAAGRIASLESGRLAGARPLEGILLPGFIDLHLHGGDGADFLDGSVSAIERILTFHQRHGTTGLLATLASAPVSRLNASLAALGAASRAGWGISLLGIHLEGPELNPRCCGIQPPQAVRPLAPEERLQLWQAGAGGIRLVTVAPELPGGKEAVAFWTGQGVRVALGHSLATSEEAEGAIRQGVSHLTHGYNAMAPWLKREVGPVGVLLRHPAVTVEAIADGFHLHPLTLRQMALLFPQQLLLVTDAMAPAGLGQGTFPWMGQPLASDGQCLRGPDGRLAGSLLTMNRALRTFARATERTLWEAIPFASLHPARTLGLSHRKGLIMPGYEADLVALGEDGEVEMVMQAGRMVADPQEGL